MFRITREEYNTLLEIHRKISDFDDTLESGCLDEIADEIIARLE